MRAYLEELRREAGETRVSPGELAKLAGVGVPDAMCPRCGGQMENAGSIERCPCGYLQPSSNPNLPPAGAPTGNNADVPMSGVHQSGQAGAPAGEGLDGLLAQVMEARKAQAGAQAQGSGQPLSDKIAGLLKSAKDLYIPVGRGIPGMATPSTRLLLPSSSQVSMRVDLAPSLMVSPAVGVTPTGLSFGVLVKRRPDGVPANSVVGKGLEKQRPGAAVEVRLKEAAARVVPKIRGA